MEREHRRVPNPDLGGKIPVERNAIDRGLKVEGPVELDRIKDSQVAIGLNTGVNPCRQIAVLLAGRVDLQDKRGREIESRIRA